jgi:hypothetical protein
MTSLPRRAGLAVVAVALPLTLATGCGGQKDDRGLGGVAGKAITPVAMAVPPAVLGLKVAKEDMTEPVKEVDSTYVEALSMYSFRRDELLQATLQVSRITDKGETDTDRFRRAVVNQLGDSTPQQVRLGDTTVYLTSGTDQRLAVWFQGQYFFVLASRNDFEQPRSLLRSVLELRP